MSELTNYSQLIKTFIDTESLPQSYGEDAEKWFVTLAELCLELTNTVPDLPVYIGINGCQGSGKSTLARLLQTLLRSADKNVAVLSIDDFYLGSGARQKLAATVHPLLATRGVPGTHDCRLAMQCLEALARLGPGESLALPAFNKAADEPFAKDEWPSISGPVDMVILEGWFVGAPPQDDKELQEPINALESNEDPRAEWRCWVNERLLADYQTLFQLLDLLIMLRAPDFECVFGWRKQQEDKLRQHMQGSENLQGLMDDDNLRRFIQHYERLTRHCLENLPAMADISFNLDHTQRISNRVDREIE